MRLSRTVRRSVTYILHRSMHWATTLHPSLFSSLSRVDASLAISAWPSRSSDMIMCSTMGHRIAGPPGPHVLSGMDRTKRATIPDWISDHPRAACLARKDPAFMARTMAAATEAERAELLREAIRRFPATPADVVALESETTD